MSHETNVRESNLASFLKKVLLLIFAILFILIPLTIGDLYDFDRSSKEVFRPKYLKVEDIDEGQDHVIFYSNDYIYEIIYADENGVFNEPEISPKLDYAKFILWTDIDDGTVVSFPRQSTTRLVVKAVFDVDYKKLTNELTVNQMKSTVTVEIHDFINIFGLNLIPTFKLSGGSGVIFHKQNGYYYLLTNYHVANKNKSKTMKSSSVKVYDYLGNEYRGFFKEEYSDEKLDTAVIVFKEGNVELKTQKFAQKNPEIGSELLVMGSPTFQKNSITYGKVISYKDIIMRETNKTYPGLLHSVPTSGGSSGSGTFNIGMRIVGLHFSGNGTPLSLDGNSGGSIPIEYILKHLDERLWVN